MNRPSVSKYVNSTADSFLDQMERHGIEDGAKLGYLHRAIEDGSRQIAELVAGADELDEDNPGPREERYSQELFARLVKIAAAASAALVIVPLEESDVGPMLPIVAKMGQA